MAILNNETIKGIEEGQVLEVTYPSGRKEIGVVYGNDVLGIKFNKMDNSKFGFGPIMIKEGSIEYEVLEEHEPVAKYGMEFDFVHKHE